MGLVAFIDRQLGLDATLSAHQTAGQQHEDADVRHDEARLPPAPGKTQPQGARHVHRQQNAQCEEPTGVVDAEMSRRRAVAAFDQRAPGEHHDIECNQHDGQLQ